MKFERLVVPTFGVLRNLDTGDEALGRLVVVHGPNEAGKSTFFEAVTTVLFGFSPATRDLHPYTPWSGADAEVQARLILDDGRRLEVHRRLLKSATGRVTLDGTEQALRNRPLKAVGTVPRELYRQVYALTLTELAALSTESWDRLQERLLSHMGAHDIVAARSVAEALEEEAAKLWRPTRRGNQQVDQLKEEIRERMASRRDAVDNDRRIRLLDETRDLLQEDLGRARNERARAALIVDRVTVLLPLQRRLDRIGTLQDSAESGPPLDDLPDDPGGTLGRLGEELADLEEQQRVLCAEKPDVEEIIQRFTPQMQQALDARPEVAEATSVAAQAESTQLQNAQLEQNLNDLERRIATAARELFMEALDEDATQKLRELGVGELGARIDHWLEAKRSAEDAIGRSEAAAARRPALWEPLAGGVAVILSAGLFGLGNSSGTAAVGGVLLAVGGVLLGRWVFGRRLARTGSGSRRGGDVASHQVACETAHAQVQETLKGLPVRDRKLDREFVAQLARLQELREDQEDRQQFLDEGTARVHAATRTVADLGDRLGLELPRNVSAATHRLERHLTEAERAEEAAMGAERELSRIVRGLEGLAEQIQSVGAERGVLVELLSRFGDGNFTEGIEILARRRRAGEDATRLHDDLLREHPDLDDLVAQIAEAENAGEEWLADDRKLAVARARLEELSAAIEQMAASAEGITTEMVHLQQVVTTDQIDGEVAVLREALEETKRERDRKIVLAQIVRRADREFRERNDPDVIEGAAQHLAAVTHGRYHQLVAPDADPSASLRVIDPDSGREIEIAQVSTATREQVYFSLRLAIMDHLDSSDERLPILVDEAFVNWDPQRRVRVLDVLERLSESRQVFVFTCHPEWAKDLCSRGGTLISLDHMDPEVS